MCYKKTSQCTVLWVSDECNRVEIPYKKIKPDRIMCGPTCSVQGIPILAGIPSGLSCLKEINICCVATGSNIYGQSFYSIINCLSIRFIPMIYSLCSAKSTCNCCNFNRHVLPLE